MSWKVIGQVVAAPFMGAAFALFLPFIGFVMVACHLWQAVVQAVAASNKKSNA